MVDLFNKRKGESNNSNSNSDKGLSSSSSSSSSSPSLSSLSSSVTSSIANKMKMSLLETLIKNLLDMIHPDYLRKCIEYDLYIFSSITYAYANSSIISEKLLMSNYGLTKEQAATLLQSMRISTGVLRILQLIHHLIKSLNIQTENITVESMERLFQKYAPELYEVYKSYGERGRRWLYNEIEYDLKRFLTGKKKIQEG